MAWKNTIQTILKTNGTYTFPNTSDNEETPMADGLIHHITVAAGDATAGTMTFSATPYGGDVAEPVYESDGTTQKVITLTAGTSRSFNLTNYSIETLSVVNASVNGTGTITITVRSWVD